VNIALSFYWTFRRLSQRIRESVFWCKFPTLCLLVLLIRVVLRWSWAWNMVELYWREDRNRPTRRKFSLIATLSTSNLTWTAPVSNPSLLREQPADGHLSYAWKSSSYPTDNRSRVHYEDQLIGAVQGSGRLVLWGSCGAPNCTVWQSAEFLNTTALCAYSYHWISNGKFFFPTAKHMLRISQVSLHQRQTTKVKYIWTVFL